MAEKRGKKKRPIGDYLREMGVKEVDPEVYEAEKGITTSYFAPLRKLGRKGKPPRSDR